MNASAHSARLHHRDVDFNLARAGATAAKLTGLHIHKADILFFHETLAAQRRSAKHEILANAHGDIAAVTVGVATSVDATTHFANLAFNRTDRGGNEELVEFLASLGLRTVLPVVSAIDKRRIDVEFFVHCLDFLLK